MKKLFAALNNLIANLFKTKHKDIPPAEPIKTVETVKSQPQTRTEDLIAPAGETRLPTVSNAAQSSPVETKAEQETLQVAVQPKHPGWRVVPREKIPAPTYWPTLAALGAVLFVAGFVMTFVLWIVGAALFIIGMVGWMGDIRFEQRHRE